eukprot:TRINITY_DN13834_c1_g1_i1.p1 TRINITY_DN13834_c1_g1~~TRINITY_DN13834_c1_g1_i1.p1  ORF type:complete len:555 (+),score=129.14 TRINITY_DN13834_c1_g1_i1:52-1665(+)
MSDSEDDMAMPGIGVRTTKEDEPEMSEEEEVKPVEQEKEVKIVETVEKPKAEDMTVVDDDEAEPVKVLKSALKSRSKIKKKAGVSISASAKVEDGKPTSATASLSLIRKLQGALRAQAVKAKTEAGHTTFHIPKEPAKDPNAPKREPREPSTYLRVHQDQGRFVGGWYTVVKKFVDDASRKSYTCPNDLNGYDRKMLHQLAEHFNLGHQSYGQGSERRLILTKDRLFYDLGKSDISQTRLQELEEWTNMRKHFDPTSGRITNEVVAKIDGEKEYVPGDALETMKKVSEREREDEDNKSRVQRLMKLRLLNEIGCFTDNETLDEHETARPSEPDAKKRRVENGTGTTAKTPMQAFLESGLAPKTIKITRPVVDGEVESLGIKLTKQLFITGVSGPSEACGVPVDMFINEVDGNDINSPGEFSTAIKGLSEFTVTLWYLRKDGYTASKLKDIAARAEAALERAVGTEDVRTIIVQQTCTVCESSSLIDAPWEGTRKKHCEDCGETTEWITERYEETNSSDDEAEEQEEDTGPDLKIINE